MATIELLHGSDHIIYKPELKLGKTTNDYGKGFYCTKSIEMANEWACKENENGFTNRYELEDTGLKVLNLLDGNHTVLNWVALLLKNRNFSLDTSLGVQAREYIINNFLIDTKDYDIVIGYRADDSYFSYAKDFVKNSISINSLSKALYLGKLGEQIVLISNKSFEQLKFIDAKPVDKEVYYPKFLSRDMKARKEYQKVLNGESIMDDSEIYVLDILRGKIKSNDSRIQRIILR